MICLNVPENFGCIITVLWFDAKILYERSEQEKFLGQEKGRLYQGKFWWVRGAVSVSHTVFPGSLRSFFVFSVYAVFSEELILNVV
jgi:hypothetical protein